MHAVKIESQWEFSINLKIIYQKKNASSGIECQWEFPINLQIVYQKEMVTARSNTKLTSKACDL